MKRRIRSKRRKTRKKEHTKYNKKKSTATTMDGEGKKTSERRNRKELADIRTVYGEGKNQRSTQYTHIVYNTENRQLTPICRQLMPYNNNIWLLLLLFSFAFRAIVSILYYILSFFYAVRCVCDCVERYK